LATTNIEELLLDANPFLSNKDIIELAKSSHLKKLSLIGSIKLNEAGATAFSKNTSLKWLNLDSTYLSKNVIKILSENQTLIHLFFEDYNKSDFKNKFIRKSNGFNSHLESKSSLKFLRTSREEI